MKDSEQSNHVEKLTTTANATTQLPATTSRLGRSLNFLLGHESLPTKLPTAQSKYLRVWGERNYTYLFFFLPSAPVCDVLETTLAFVPALVFF